MHYLIWQVPLLTNTEKRSLFSKLNKLSANNPPPEVVAWLAKFNITYPNPNGTQQYAQFLECVNPSSTYFGSITFPVFDAIYPELVLLIPKLKTMGLPEPDEGVTTPLTKLPDDWYAKTIL